MGLGPGILRCKACTWTHLSFSYRVRSNNTEVNITVRVRLEKPCTERCTENSCRFWRSGSKKLYVGNESRDSHVPHAQRHTGMGKVPEPPSSLTPGPLYSHPMAGTRSSPHFQEQAREPDTWFHACRQLAQEPQKTLTEFLVWLLVSLLIREGKESWSGSKDKIQPTALSCKLNIIRAQSYAFICLQSRVLLWGFPGGSVVKNLPANAGDAEDMDLIPGSGGSPGGENGNPLQYSKVF